MIVQLPLFVNIKEFKKYWKGSTDKRLLDKAIEKGNLDAS